MGSWIRAADNSSEQEQRLEEISSFPLILQHNVQGYQLEAGAYCSSFFVCPLGLCSSGIARARPAVFGCYYPPIHIRVISRYPCVKSAPVRVVTQKTGPPDASRIALILILARTKYVCTAVPLLGFYYNLITDSSLPTHRHLVNEKLRSQRKRIRSLRLEFVAIGINNLLWYQYFL